jgi:hypothetical protein
LPQNNAALVLQANDVHASVTVSVIPGNFADQATVASLTEARIACVDSDFRSDLEAIMRLEGARMIQYPGTSKEKLGSLWSLVTHYMYEAPDGFPWCMESHRIFLGIKSVGLMLQTTFSAPRKVHEMIATARESFQLNSSN